MKAEQRLLGKFATPFTLGQIDVGNFRINYIQGGKGEPLLLIHGANIGWGQWHLNLDEMAKKNEVFAIDLPGSGGSTKIEMKDSNLEEDFVETVHQFLEKKGITQVNICAHSLGGWVALKLSLRAPQLVKKMVLLSPVGLSSYLPWQYRLMGFSFFVRVLTQKCVPVNRKNMADFLGSVCKKKDFLTDDFVDYYFESITRGERVTHPFWCIHRLCDIGKMRSEFYLADEIKTIRAEVLWIWGREDPLFPLRKNANISNALKGKTEVFENTGHVACLENHSLFNEICCRYLG
ncbi:MAG: alpha/beta fold family hydrolase [Parcubacteria group bacterium Gr01-1014_18]|nr:MAG: alpha/beta fold family hydrolase [Parcubacteria group bacterium Greene0416_36]TSC81341.1 MAG: alpha/beta fold family hydrolase [Parcubacteria group bacterium Gr01-1014_18]TSC99473.1 MAG: alpha/beta fold family hydrolase [Parcubacteria group bacterium Greene1014_20]TSD07608.1 MAG: alpha/beta fold family hydrolase [Parcubacteria group bacterium Greene0714_2]